MAMTPGTVTIDPVTGAVTSQTGAAGAAFAVLEAGFPHTGLAGPDLATCRQANAAIATAIATAVAHVVANAAVSVPVTIGALQTSTALAAPTGPPAVPQTLHGTVA